jgi:hypothetical protein
MGSAIPMLAGAVSSVVFVCSTLPMLVKAARTRDLSSYSLGNILLSNLGNLIHAVYVFHLPAGPIWALHSFHLLSTALMLVWYLRYTASPILRRRPGWGRSPDAGRRVGGNRRSHRDSLRLYGPAQGGLTLGHR